MFSAIVAQDLLSFGGIVEGKLPMSAVIRFDRDRLMDELSQFFERETGIYASDPRTIPIELRVPDRRAALPARRRVA